MGEWDRVLMLRQYRFTMDQWGYELLGGLVEEGKKHRCVDKRSSFAGEPGGHPTSEAFDITRPIIRTIGPASETCI